jgi:hypothetical protein
MSGSRKSYKPPKRIHTIHIEIIPLEDMYMDYHGDYWWEKDGTLQIRCSRYPNEIQEIGTIDHEMLEAWKLKVKGVSVKDVEKFDKEHEDHDDPGCLPDAPYHKEHMESMQHEKLLCEQMGFDWDKYYNTEPIKKKPMLTGHGFKAERLY